MLSTWHENETCAVLSLHEVQRYIINNPLILLFIKVIKTHAKIPMYIWPHVFQ